MMKNLGRVTGKSDYIVFITITFDAFSKNGTIFFLKNIISYTSKLQTEEKSYFNDC